MADKHWRSVIKGASWRAVGTMDTIFLSFLFTGKINTALSIGAVEVFTKIFLFYLHERVWMRLPFGTRTVTENGVPVKTEAHYRSIIKGVSWRAVGSLDTFWIALVVNHSSAHATQTAFYIAATEVFTKVALFWLHERLWMRVNWGANRETAAVKPEKLVINKATMELEKR
jgi:uncharacterized membrane protein